METNQEIREFWDSRGGLISMPLEVVEKYNLATEDSEHLVLIGLPAYKGWHLNFVDMPSIEEEMKNVINGLVIGGDYEAPIWIRGAPGGILSGIEPESIYFMNHSMTSLNLSLIEYQKYREKVLNMSESAAQRLISETEERLIKIDDPAFQKDKSYWKCIVTQMRAGML